MIFWLNGLQLARVHRGLNAVPKSDRDDLPVAPVVTQGLFRSLECYVESTAAIGRMEKFLFVLRIAKLERPSEPVFTYIVQQRALPLLMHSWEMCYKTFNLLFNMYRLRLTFGKKTFSSLAWISLYNQQSLLCLKGPLVSHLTHCLLFLPKPICKNSKLTC